MAIFQNPFTSVVDAIDNIALFGIQLAPAINEWVKTQVPLWEQRTIIKTLKRCDRLCRHEKLTDEMVATQVKVLFPLKTVEQQGDITMLMIAWLHQNK